MTWESGLVVSGFGGFEVKGGYLAGAGPRSEPKLTVLVIRPEDISLRDSCKLTRPATHNASVSSPGSGDLHVAMVIGRSRYQHPTRPPGIQCVLPDAPWEFRVAGGQREEYKVAGHGGHFSCDFHLDDLQSPWQPYQDVPGGGGGGCSVWSELTTGLMRGTAVERPTYILRSASTWDHARSVGRRVGGLAFRGSKQRSLFRRRVGGLAFRGSKQRSLFRRRVGGLAFRGSKQRSLFRRRVGRLAFRVSKQRSLFRRRVGGLAFRGSKQRSLFRRRVGGLAFRGSKQRSLFRRRVGGLAY